MNKKTAKIIIIISLSIAFFLTISISWLYGNFGHLTLEEIVFHLKVPMEGTSTDMIWKYLIQCPWKVIALTIIVSILLINRMNATENQKDVKVSVRIAIFLFVASITYIIISTNIIGYVYNQTNDSTFIAEEYVNPEEVNVEFLDEKKNLIYIFLESMETTFYSTENGGLSENELMPEIAQLAKKYEDFSDTDTLGGAYALNGSTWTIAAMTAQTAGVPLKIGIEGNSLSEYSSFLDGAHTIGEILEDKGYHNFLLLGSDAVFGGRKNLFEQHGNYEIWDLESAMAEQRITEKVWWGYSDDMLFEFAKEKILKLSQEDKPFNFTMLTVDTHFPDGYVCEECPNKWDEQYKNVISCSSAMVGEFVEWIQAQDFYEDTTIVIAGDHLTMQKNFFELEDEQEYDKKVVNVIINSAVEPTKTNRKYSTFDLYPTTLAAIGATIEGNKLGLGTNLFSDELTLIERYGKKDVNKELRKVSKFYDNNILVENKEGK